MSQQAAAPNQMQSRILRKQRSPKNTEPQEKPPETHKKSTIAVMSKRHKRLFSMIVKTLLEHGNLEGQKAGVVALAKEAKVGKAQLKEFIDMAREKYPEINDIARIVKSINTLKSTGEKPGVDSFNRLQPEAIQAGKDDFWLGEKLGFLPPELEKKRIADNDKNTKKPFFGLLRA